MTEKEKILAQRWMECKNVILEKQKEAHGLICELRKLAPHKAGEIIRWTGVKRRNVGSWLKPTSEVLPPTEMIAVLTRIEPIVDTYGELDVFYKYSFRLVKKDGGISVNNVRPTDGYEWTGEVHKDYIGE